MPCQLCHRDLPLTFHHLIPKKVQDKTYIKNKLEIDDDLNTYGVNLCKDCHSMVHRKIGHHDLALQYNSIEKLLSHPEIEKFVNWVAKQNKKVKRK